VIGDVVVFAAVKPMTVVCVEDPAVTIVTGDVPTFRLMNLVNVFAICNPFNLS
jgi:hypothetical protein